MKISGIGLMSIKIVKKEEKNQASYMLYIQKEHAVHTAY